MYRRPRKKTYIAWLIGAAALLVLAGLGFGLYSLIVGTPSLDKNAISLPTPDKEGIFPWKDGVLSVYQNKLICNNLDGSSPWGSGSVDLPVTGMKARREGDFTVVWGGKNIMVVEKDGRIKNNKVNEAPGEVVLAVPGVTTYAAITQEENQHRLRVYSMKDGSEIDEVLFPYASVLDMGYFGDKSGQIWVLTVDSHGVQPITKLTTYLPGKNSTRSIPLRDEIGYRAVLQEKQTYLVGTHTMTYWENTSQKQSTLVYGWNLQDVFTEKNGSVSFLFSPAGGDENGQISSLWYINTAGREYRIPMPAGVIRAMLKDNGRICAVTPKGAYSMAQNGTGSRFYPFSITVESIPAVVPGKAFVIYAGHRNYLINMP